MAKQVQIPDGPMPKKDYDKLLNYLSNSGIWYAGNGSPCSYLIRAKLVKKGVPEDGLEVLVDGERVWKNPVDEIIVQLHEFLLIDDDEYINNFVRRAMLGGKGIFAAKMKLRQKGIPMEAIDSALEDSDFEEAGLEVLEKALAWSLNTNPVKREMDKRAKGEHHNLRGAILKYLNGRGFSFQEAQEFLEGHSVFEEPEADNDF